MIKKLKFSTSIGIIMLCILGVTSLTPQTAHAGLFGIDWGGGDSSGSDNSSSGGGFFDNAARGIRDAFDGGGWGQNRAGEPRSRDFSGGIFSGSSSERPGDGGSGWVGSGDKGWGAGAKTFQKEKTTIDLIPKATSVTMPDLVANTALSIAPRTYPMFNGYLLIEEAKVDNEVSGNNPFTRPGSPVDVDRPVDPEVTNNLPPAGANSCNAHYAECPAGKERKIQSTDDYGCHVYSECEAIPTAGCSVSDGCPAVDGAHISLLRDTNIDGDNPGKNFFTGLPTRSTEMLFNTNLSVKLSQMKNNLLVDYTCDGTVDTQKTFTIGQRPGAESMKIDISVPFNVDLTEDGCFAFEIDTENIITESNEKNNTTQWSQYESDNSDKLPVVGVNCPVYSPPQCTTDEVLTAGATRADGCAEAPYCAVKETTVVEPSSGITFETKVYTSGVASADGPTIKILKQDWTAAEQLQVKESDILHFRWNTQAFDKCLVNVNPVRYRFDGTLTNLKGDTEHSGIEVRTRETSYGVDCSRTVGGTKETIYQNVQISFE